MAKGPREGSGVLPCTNQDCGELTRPSVRKLADYPGTRSRRAGGLCPRCHERDRAKARREKTLLTNPDPYTVAGLTSFINRRRARQTNQRTSEHSAV